MVIFEGLEKEIGYCSSMHILIWYFLDISTSMLHSRRQIPCSTCDATVPLCPVDFGEATGTKAVAPSAHLHIITNDECCSSAFAGFWSLGDTIGV